MKFPPAEEIDQKLEDLVDRTLAMVYEADPAMAKKYGAIGRQRCREDIVFHYCTLTEAIAADDPFIFEQYIGWGKIVLASRKISSKDLELTLEQMCSVCRKMLSPDTAEAACNLLMKALQKLPAMPSGVPSYVQPDAPLASYTNRYLAALLSANRDEARRVAQGAIHGGARVEDVFLYIFERAQREIGRLWQENEISVAQEHYATSATELLIAELSHPIPHTRLPHSFVGTCASGESHCIGIRMISELLDKQGWKVYFTGANTPIPSVVDMFKHFPIEVLGISAATAMQLRNVRRLIDAFRKNPHTREVKILVGGKIFNDSPLLWKTIGADGFAPDAIQGVKLANRLVTKTPKAPVRKKSRRLPRASR